MSFKKLLLSLGLGLVTCNALADGGISISSTRIIYPAGPRTGQVPVTLHNSSTTDTYLIQSWVEDSTGTKSHDMVVTPPLYVSHPGNENVLRLMHAGGTVPPDHESLYYFIAKAIPALDQSSMDGKNTVTMAAAQRIKLFVRPEGLHPDVADAPGLLTFRRDNGRLVITNPSPYYITLTSLKVGHASLKDGMVAPGGSYTQALPAGATGAVTFHTINDFGAVTPEQTSLVR